MKKYNQLLKLFICGIASLTFINCSMAISRHQLLPASKCYTDNEIKKAEEIDILRDGEPAKKPIVRIAKVVAHGNGFATMETLESKLKEVTASLGGDLVYVTQYQVTNDETIGSYGSGLMISEQIKRPHLYGIACRYSKVRLGVNWGTPRGLIVYVTSGSIAEKIGLKEGYRIIAINGKFIDVNGYVLETELSAKNPGDKIKIEYLDTDQNKKSAEIVL